MQIFHNENSDEVTIYEEGEELIAIILNEFGYRGPFKKGHKLGETQITLGLLEFEDSIESNVYARSYIFTHDDLPTQIIKKLTASLYTMIIMGIS